MLAGEQLPRDLASRENNRSLDRCFLMHPLELIQRKEREVSTSISKTWRTGRSEKLAAARAPLLQAGHAAEVVGGKPASSNHS